MTHFTSSRRALKIAGCGAFAALTMGFTSARAQTSYSTDFNNTTTFPTGASIDAEDGWDDSDKVSFPDSVGTVNNFSPVTADHAVEFGGAFINNGFAPSTSPVYISHGFAPVGNFSLDTDMLLTASGTPAANNNTFGFTFRTGTALAGFSNLFSVTFQPQNATNPSSAAQADNIQYTTYAAITGAATTTSIGGGNGAIFLGQRYHLTIAVNITALTNNLTLTFTPQTVANSAVTNGTPVSFVRTLPANDVVGVSNVAATYLATPSPSAGYNSIIFDNFSAVPEPSTYAMLGLGLLGLAVRFRRKARA